MGLSYQLTADNYPWWSTLGEWLGNANGAQGYRMGQMIEGVDQQWSGGGFFGGQSPAATGEYIIRDGYYHNGIYIIVGSYRGYFSQLKATGAPGYAWDGFILFHRGYNVVARPFEPLDYSVFPMNWPTICDAIDPALLNDDDLGIGLYGVTPLKSTEDINAIGSIGLGQQNLQIVVGGYHVAPPTVVPTNAQTIAAAAQLSFSNLSITDNMAQYGWNNTRSILFGMDYDQTMLNPTQTMVFRDWRDVIALGESNLLGAVPYERVLWEGGCKPDGSNPGFGPTSSDNSIQNNGYLPTKIFGVRSVAGVTTSADLTDVIEGGIYFCGQVATCNAAKIIETECPFYMALGMGKKTLDGIYDNSPPLNYLGPYCVMVSALTSTLIPGINTPYDSGMGLYISGFLMADVTNGTTPSQCVQALEGAAATDILPPAELTGAFAGGNISPLLLTIGNTEYPSSGGEPNRGAIYSANGFPIFGEPALPIGVAGGAMETVSNVFLPSGGFACSLQQFRTYTFAEENESMRVAINSKEERQATPDSIYDDDTNQFVGWVGNYPRYDTSKLGGIIAGKQTFKGYAAVGWYDGTDASIEAAAGPCLISYDTGSPGLTTLTYTSGGPPPAPVSQGKVNYTMRLREDGAKLNAAIDVGGGGPPGLRKCDWGAWDNDRDQWLFCVAGDGADGVSIVSVDAPFTTFLDQSKVFPAAQNSDWETAKYFPISMSDALDGLVVFGERTQDVFGNVGIVPKYGPDETVVTPWGPGTYKAKSTVELVAYRITGSTGRTARVWIDYMLYDGVDAVIAMQLRDWGMRVTVENVEWFKARVLQDGDLKAKGEEIEEWMEEQGRQYQDMMKQKERSGRLRKRRSQISAYKREVEDLMTPDQIDSQVYDFVPKGIAAQQRLKTSEGALKEVPPDSIEAMVERDYRAGFDTTPSGVTEPGQQLAEDPAKPAGTFMDTGDAPKKAPDEGGDPDEEYISEN
jgi:hypothetical protein